MLSADAVRHDHATSERTLGRFVAETTPGVVVGVARVRPHGPRTMVMVQVDPAHRQRGHGRALLDAALAVTPAGEVGGIVADDAGSLAAAAAWGFEPERWHAISAIDPRTVLPTETGPHAGPTVPLADVDPRLVWECGNATAGDDPSGLSHAVPYDAFLADDWGQPDHAPSLGRAVLGDDGRVRSFAMLTAAGDRAWNAFTGTHPDHRGQGLAHRVKAASLGAAAAAGITRVSTGNDDANAPMLAVNARLGYTPFARTCTAVRVAHSPAGR